MTPLVEPTEYVVVYPPIPEDVASVHAVVSMHTSVGGPCPEWNLRMSTIVRFPPREGENARGRDMQPCPDVHLRFPDKDTALQAAAVLTQRLYGQQVAFRTMIDAYEDAGRWTDQDRRNAAHAATEGSR